MSTYITYSCRTLFIYLTIVYGYELCELESDDFMVIVLDGKALSNKIKISLAKRVSLLKEKGIEPGLGTLLVGNDSSSMKYVAGKHRDCQEVGIRSIRYDLPQDASEEDVLKAVESLNNDPSCTGFIVQLPLPKGIDEKKIIEAVDPKKDCDGMHPYNLGELVMHISGKITTPLPCTPRGILALLDEYNINLDGKEVCVLGRGITVGRTIGLLLTRRGVDATVTLCHTHTRNVHEIMRRSDVIIAAIGSAGFVKPDDVKPGAVLVDVGLSFVFDEESGKYRLKGDVDVSCRDVAGAYSPNPGGVGLMTRAMLLANVVNIAENQVC